MSRFGSASFRAMYRVLAWADPSIGADWWRTGIRNIVELRVARLTT